MDLVWIWFGLDLDMDFVLGWLLVIGWYWLVLLLYHLDCLVN